MGLLSGTCGTNSDRFSSHDAGRDSLVDQSLDFHVCDANCVPPDDYPDFGDCGPVTGSCTGDGVAGRFCAEFSDVDPSAVIAACDASGGVWATTPCMRSTEIKSECQEVRPTDCVTSLFGDTMDPPTYCADHGGVTLIP